MYIYIIFIINPSTSERIYLITYSFLPLGRIEVKGEILVQECEHQLIQD